MENVTTTPSSEKSQPPEESNDNFKLLSDYFITKRSKYNESKYRYLFTKLIQSNAGLANTSNSDPERAHLYKAETILLENAISAERDAVLGGIVVGICAFVSFRYGPSFIIKRIGNEAKIRALREAEEETRKAKYGFLRLGMSLAIEGALGGWAGYKGYQAVSVGREDIYKEIASIPLVEGRSVISEGLCADWVGTYNTVPTGFWKELEEGSTLRDERAWRAIRSFAVNCMKRETVEARLRESMSPLDLEQLGDEPLFLPSPGVPVNTAFDEKTTLLSRKEVNALVSDRS